MISIDDLYGVLCAVVPLYVTMFLAYASVKWWNIFTPEQCSGINRFVAYFAVPLLSMEFISRINPYKMDLLFMAADGVSKVLILVVLLCWANFSRRGSLEWAITLFSLSTLPNTLVMGIPLLKSMYGDDKEGLMIQVVVLQCIIWVLGKYLEAVEVMQMKLLMLLFQPLQAKRLLKMSTPRYGIMKPQIVDNSVTILSKAGLGMAMFSLGLFMALQPRIIACGNRMAVYGMLARFLAGPAVMAVASIGVGLRGTTLKLSIVQAALPQGIVPFVFAREYGLHPDVLSTAGCSSGDSGQEIQGPEFNSAKTSGI
ncbi:hypothetical protein POTOM_048547 [Populus tomentosa]|uniref:Auxin efflux carrier component n=1 Tax=Populus tomentosa TaxID=118781 RepID=A0A8X7Y9B2_POPTO|nr:hypothetical protein POTOM_048547 [Populus tomentosa]